MNRVRILGFLVGALTVLALAVPVSALAGTFTWNLTNDSTTSGFLTNPGSDQYGQVPWSYDAAPSTSSRLPDFATPSGLSVWSTSTAGAAPRVGFNPTANPISDGNATVQPQQVFLDPAPGGLVAVGWTSPFSSQPETVSINASFTSAESAAPPSCTTYASTWSVVDQSGTPLTGGTPDPATGTLPASSSFSGSVTVNPGASIFFTVSTPPGDCGPTGLTLQIQADGAANANAPVVTLTGPASGSSSTVASPTFSGAAGSGFPASSQVTLNVYSGGSASGNPVQTVTVPASGAAWSATLGSALPLGTYTAQAQQPDVVGDVGVSAPVTFSVTAPAVSLDSLGSGPLNTSTPTFSGTADTDPGSNASVQIEVFAGSTAAGAPVQTLNVPPSASGQYSVAASPALSDGTYTAIAAQGSVAGNVGHSAPQSFSVDTQPPQVTLVSPGPRLDVLQLVFTGLAGTQPFDSNVVNVALYKGHTVAGAPFKTLPGTVKGAKWSATWPGTQLPHGVYTAVASQTDLNNHIGTSAPSTFQIVGLPPVISGPVTINRAGVVSLKLSCNEPPGDTCATNVRVLTTGSFQTVAGGPLGVLSVMFAFVQIPGGQTQLVARHALPEVAAVLRRHATVSVAISASLRPHSGKTIKAITRTRLRRISA